MNRPAPATNAFKLVITTLYGLEAELAEELRGLGARDIVVKNRAVECSGNQKLMYEINIRCYTAVRVLKVLRTFRVRDERMLYKQMRSINWAEFLDATGTLAIDTVVNQSVFNNSLYVAQLAKDAIADQFREQTGERPSVDLVNPDLRINLHMYDNYVTLSLD
ncbi:MAG: THUMP domain-containing protein, partial [Hymenobacteraceae bacterium]|nr:THUMP domain-containing protein [Hymenobacteraceae bacterium]MDX5395632.1 THUMP domain-containing protein [Hymenobacteraceae bacterium]MDX5511686.1 THUMP domain-containing protein [Hymenobacteraceae bacterium]